MRGGNRRTDNLWGTETPTGANLRGHPNTGVYLVGGTKGRGQQFHHPLRPYEQGDPSCRTKDSHRAKEARCVHRERCVNYTGGHIEGRRGTSRALSSDGVPP